MSDMITSTELLAFPVHHMEKFAHQITSQERLVTYESLYLMRRESHPQPLL
jgi:hypothetical protein